MKEAKVIAPELPPIAAFMSREEIAEFMHVSTKTIDRWVALGMPSETWGLRSRHFQPALVLQWARARGRIAA